MNFLNSYDYFSNQNFSKDELAKQKIIENEIEFLKFIIFNETKIMYIIRHNSDQLYTFNVNHYVDVFNILKKKQFHLLEMDDSDEDGKIDEEDLLLSVEKKKIAFHILDIVSQNVDLNLK